MPSKKRRRPAHKQSPPKSLTQAWRQDYIRKHRDRCLKVRDALQTDDAFNGMPPSRYSTADVKMKIAEAIAYRIEIFRYQRSLRERTDLFKQMRTVYRQGARRMQRLVSLGDSIAAQ